MHIHLCTAYLVLFCVHVEVLESIFVIIMRICACHCLHAYLVVGVLIFF